MSKFMGLFHLQFPTMGEKSSKLYLEHGEEWLLIQKIFCYINWESITSTKTHKNAKIDEKFWELSPEWWKLARKNISTWITSAASFTWNKLK